MMQPMAKMSIAFVYERDLSSNSGALYHLVETYSVRLKLFCISFARPKSASLRLVTYELALEPGNLNCLLLIRKFSGLMSLCMKPFLWT